MLTDYLATGRLDLLFNVCRSERTASPAFADPKTPYRTLDEAPPTFPSTRSHSPTSTASSPSILPLPSFALSKPSVSCAPSRLKEAASSTTVPSRPTLLVPTRRPTPSPNMLLLVLPSLLLLMEGHGTLLAQRLTSVSRSEPLRALAELASSPFLLFQETPSPRWLPRMALERCRLPAISSRSRTSLSVLSRPLSREQG